MTPQLFNKIWNQPRIPMRPRQTIKWKNHHSKISWHCPFERMISWKFSDLLLQTDHELNTALQLLFQACIGFPWKCIYSMSWKVKILQKSAYFWKFLCCECLFSRAGHSLFFPGLLSAQFLPMDRYRSTAHFVDFQVCSSLNRSKTDQWFPLRKER